VSHDYHPVPRPRGFLKAKKSDSSPQKTSHNSRTYLEVCDREYLFEEQVEAMVKATFKGRWKHRDSTLILMGYSGGFGYRSWFK
jgi:hypothetical protein